MTSFSYFTSRTGICGNSKTSTSKLVESFFLILSSINFSCSSVEVKGGAHKPLGSSVFSEQWHSLGKVQAFLSCEIENRHFRDNVKRCENIVLFSLFPSCQFQNQIFFLVFFMGRNDCDKKSLVHNLSLDSYKTKDLCSTVQQDSRELT